MHDALKKDYLKNEFLKWPGFGVDSVGRNKLAELIKNKSILEPSILDVPCGNSINYQVFKQYDFDFQYYGADLTDKLIESSIELYPELHDHFTLCYIQDLPFVPGQFDIVVARHIFEHIPDWRKAIQECLRVASKYTYLIFFKEPGYNEDIKLEKRRTGDFYLNTYRRFDIEQQFKDYEFNYYPNLVSESNNTNDTTDYIYEVMNATH